MEKKNVLVFVMFRSSVAKFGYQPACAVHHVPISDLMDSRLYLDSEVTLSEYVDGYLTRIVDVIDGEYH